MAGDHVPAILFVDVVGNVILPPLQMAGIAANVGVITGLTVTVNIVVGEQVGPVGVNV